jgi:hypothetical protein
VGQYSSSVAPKLRDESKILAPHPPINVVVGMGGHNFGP